MSKAALGELIKASIDEFIKMVLDVPESEINHVIQNFENKITILKDY